MAVVEGEDLARIDILYCIDSLQRGGTEIQLTELISRLDRRRFRPHLCTIRPTDSTLLPADCPHLGLQVPALARPGGLAALWRLRQYLRRENVAIVQTFFQDATIFGGTAAWLARVPVRLGSFRDLGFWRTRKQEFLVRRVYPLLTGFIANSEAVREHFHVADGLARERITVIANGIDPERYPFVEHVTADAVGIVGNLNRRVKRTDLFIRAAARLAPEFPEVSWHIIGDGALRPEYEELTRRLGVPERFVFTGRIANVPEYLARLAVGVICSDSEGFANAVLEYMLRGCAVVATDVGGNREALVHGRTGLLVPPGDPEALASGIAELLRAPARRQSLVRRARAAAAEGYHWDRCLERHEELYCRFLSGAAGAGQTTGREATIGES